VFKDNIIMLIQLGKGCWPVRDGDLFGDFASCPLRHAPALFLRRAKGNQNSATLAATYFHMAHRAAVAHPSMQTDMSLSEGRACSISYGHPAGAQQSSISFARLRISVRRRLPLQIAHCEAHHIGKFCPIFTIVGAQTNSSGLDSFQT
jgi:hypothetical protein